MAFGDISVHVRLKLVALWCSVMFFYIYGDYFQLYETGQLQQMTEGKMPFGGNPQGVLLGMASVMIVPSLMPFLSGNRRSSTLTRGQSCRQTASRENVRQWLDTKNSEQVRGIHQAGREVA